MNQAANANAPIGIVVVNFGSPALLERNLSWLDELEQQARLVVVNNFESPSSAAAVVETAERLGWNLLALDSNIGFGPAVNKGVGFAADLGCETFLILNPDLALTPEALALLRDAVRTHPNALVVPTVIGPDGLTWSKLGRIDLDAGRVLGSGGTDLPGWVSGACVAVGHDLWSQLGGFDEDYFLYWEDVDLSYRATGLGAKLLVLEDVVVTHDIGGTQESGGGKSKIYYFYNCRNRLVFASKHLSIRDQLRWLARTPADARRVANRGIPGPYHRLRVALWQIARGCPAGAWYMLRSVVSRRKQFP